MSIAIRGTTPAEFTSPTATISGTLTGTRSPVAGDLLVIIHCNDFYNLADMPTPTVGGSTTGVSAITNGTADNGAGNGHIKSYTYAVPTTGDLTVAVTETSVGDEEKALIVYVLSGADTTNKVEVAATAVTTTSQASHPAPSVSPGASNDFLICHDNSGGGAGVTSYTPPTGMTETYDLNVGSAMGTTGAVLQLAAAGATGTKSFTPIGSSNYCLLTLAVFTGAGASTFIAPRPMIVGQAIKRASSY